MSNPSKIASIKGSIIVIVVPCPKIVSSLIAPPNLYILVLQHPFQHLVQKCL